MIGTSDQKEKQMEKNRKTNGNDSLNTEENATRENRDGKKTIRFRPKDTPGIICIDRRTHEETVTISGSLVLGAETDELHEWIEEAIDNAAREVKERGGVVDQISAALAVTSTRIIAVSDEKPMEKEPPQKDVRISLAAVMTKIDPKEAGDIIRKALAAVRLRLREKNHPAQ